MAALDYILSMNRNDTQRTSSQIDESGENIKEEYNKLVEANEALSAELSGDISADFNNAVDRIEEDLRDIYFKFIETSETINEYTYKMELIDANAERLAGGNQYE